MQRYNYLYTQCELLKATSILTSAVEGSDMRQMKSFANASNIVGCLKSGLKTSVGKKDEIINVSFESAYPEEAAQVVNAVVDAYVTFHAKQKRDTAGEVVRILQREKTKRDAELTAKLKAMLEFKQANVGLAFESKNGNIILDRLTRLSDALNTAQLGTIDAKAAFEATRAMMNDPARVKQFVAARRAAGSLSSPTNEEARVRADLSRLQLQSLELKRQFTDTHPTIQAAENKIADLKKRLAELEKKSAEVEVAVAAQRLHAAEQKEAQIRRFFEQQREDALELNAQVAQYTILQSGWEQTKKLCAILDDRIKEINVTEDTGALNITILEVARAGAAPTSPRKTRVMAIALALGLMLGVGLALALDWMDQRIRSADEVSAALGMPVLGVVPEIRPKQTIEVCGRKVQSDPTSHVAEAYRTIRTAVYFGVPDGQAKTLLVTSPAPADGKTALVSNLAITMAQAGQRTLVLDADFRKPMQHKVFEIEQDHGLSSVLACRAALEDAIHHTTVEGLDVLPCGPVPPNPSEMLNSRAFADTLEELSKRYDHILLDSPPVMAVTDARILGATCDVTLLVLRAERCHRKAAERARDGLTSVGANILGAVVNAVPRSQDRYYYYSGYAYSRYGYGYGYGEPRRRRKARGEEGREGEPAAPAGGEDAADESAAS
jgi:capsular exopolysaccharide synthesis family protein